MKELLEALSALERLGAVWKTKRVSKGSLFDTIQCTSLIVTEDWVIKGIVEVQGKGTDDRRTKMKVTCFLEGKLDKQDKGGVEPKFTDAKHPKDKTVKIFEYENVVLYRFSRVFGVSLGLKPIGAVPMEHQHLVGFADRQAVEFDATQKVAREGVAASAECQQRENKEKGRRALFG